MEEGSGRGGREEAKRRFISSPQRFFLPSRSLPETAWVREERVMKRGRESSEEPRDREVT